MFCNNCLCVSVFPLILCIYFFYLNKGLDHLLILDKLLLTSNSFVVKNLCSRNCFVSNFQTPLNLC